MTQAVRRVTVSLARTWNIVPFLCYARHCGYIRWIGYYDVLPFDSWIARATVFRKAFKDGAPAFLFPDTSLFSTIP